MKILEIARILIILLKIYIYLKLRVDNKSFRRSIFINCHTEISHIIYQNFKSFRYNILNNHWNLKKDVLSF